MQLFFLVYHVLVLFSVLIAAAFWWAEEIFSKEKKHASQPFLKIFNFRFHLSLHDLYPMALVLTTQSFRRDSRATAQCTNHLRWIDHTTGTMNVSFLPENCNRNRVLVSYPWKIFCSETCHQARIAIISLWIKESLCFRFYIMSVV